jgi:dTDP-4-amino-4,6-dideoxygalactose transaminase
MAEDAPVSPVADPAAVAGVPLIDLKAQYSTIAGEIREAVDAVFAGQQFILGDEVASLECEVAEYCDSLHAVGCGSGTDALVLSLLALNIGAGDEVITTPFTFFATASAIRRVGATPVFVDIDPVSFNLDAERVEGAVTERTRAILPVHLFGQCAEMEPLFRIAVRKRLAIIEDACQAIGADYHGRRAGVLGTMACFSFFPTKNLGGAGDGGMITTDDGDLATRLRRLRVHGDSGGYTHHEIGLCSRLDALQAAVLRVKLLHLDAWSNARGENARRYRELFRHYELLDAVELPETLPGRRHVYNQFCVRIRGGLRDHVLSQLRANNIGAAIYYPKPLHLQEAFRDLGHSPGDFPESEAATREVLALPVYSELQPVQQETVVRGIAASLGRLGDQMTTHAAGATSTPQIHHRAA